MAAAPPPHPSPSGRDPPPRSRRAPSAARLPSPSLPPFVSLGGALPSPALLREWSPYFPHSPHPPTPKSSSRVPPSWPRSGRAAGKDCGGPGSPRRPCTWKRELTWRRRRQPQPLRRNCIVRAICTKPGGRRPPHPGIFLIYYFFFRLSFFIALSSPLLEPEVSWKRPLRSYF